MSFMSHSDLLSPELPGQGWKAPGTMLVASSSSSLHRRLGVTMEKICWRSKTTRIHISYRTWNNRGNLVPCNFVWEEIIDGASESHYIRNESEIENDCDIHIENWVSFSVKCRTEPVCWYEWLSSCRVLIKKVELCISEQGFFSATAGPFCEMKYTRSIFH